jgi:hypothetical protein
LCCGIGFNRLIGIAAVALIHLAQIPANHAAEAKLPPAVQQALEENARQLSPISVTCTTRMASRLSPEETFERLKLGESLGLGRNRFFMERPSRIIWQDNKIYVSYKYLSGGVGDNETTSQQEIVYDAAGFSMGSIIGLSKETIAEQKKRGVTNDPVVRNLTREPLAKVLQRQPAGMGVDNPYFQQSVGLLLGTISRGETPGGVVDEQQPHASSAVLSGLNGGGKLISVETTVLDGRRLVRIELEGDNPIRSRAIAYDLVNQRKMLQRNREFNEKQSARLTGPEKEMRLRFQQQQEQGIRIIEEQRKLPATRRYVFYLDPELHYAVRRFEQSYGPNALLTRSDCSRFEQIRGRQLWLPRGVETELHEYYSVPETVLKDAFLSQIVEVTALDGNRVPEETFKLDYTAAGTMVRDATDPAAAKSKDGYVSYTIPARLEDLPGVIERARNGENMLQFGGGLPLASEPRVASYRQGALIAIGLSNMVMLGAGAAYVVWRRKRGDAL